MWSYQEKVFQEIFFESILFSSTFSDIEWNVSAFCHKVFGMVVKSAFFVSNDHPKDRQLFRRKLNLSSFSDFKRNVFGLPAKNFQQGCQNCILPVRGNILGKNFFWETFFIFFGHWAKYPQPAVEILSAGFSKLHSTCPRKPLCFTMFFSEKNVFFCQYRTLSKKFSAYCGFIYCVKTTFYGSTRTFWDKLFLSDHRHCRTLSKKLLRFYRKYVGPVVKTAFYVSRGTILGKYISFFESILFFFYLFRWHWVKNLRPFVENFSAVLSKLLSTCPTNIFRF